MDLSDRCPSLRNARMHCYLPKMQQPQTKGAQCPKLGNIGAAAGWNQNPGRDSGKSGGKQRSKGGGSRGNVGRALWAPTQGIMYIYLQLWLIPWDDDNWF